MAYFTGIRQKMSVQQTSTKNLESAFFVGYGFFRCPYPVFRAAYSAKDSKNCSESNSL
jgi:hypothetical protein